jgi:hypothetical protein
MSETSIVPYQKWCGQTQPHSTHIWSDIRSDSIGLTLQCAGFSCPEHIMEVDDE